MAKGGKLQAFIEQKLGHRPGDLKLFEQALTHSSLDRKNYERLEFLGDRVLGLAMAEWLVERFPNEKEGLLSHRFTMLVSRASCAVIGADIGAAEHIRLGKQALQEGVANNENVLGDVVEALIAALYLDGGLDLARAFIRKNWGRLVDSQITAPRHPKSLLIEWAEGRGLKPPTYEIVGKSGLDHSPTFTVKVQVDGAGDATGQGASKQEAETAAAEKMLESLR